MNPCTPEELVKRLEAGGHQLVVAESCTGGLVGARVTDVPGSSKVFRGGVIAYDDALKMSRLGVPEKLFTDGHGAVSASVAEAMAEGVLEAYGGDVGIAVSGIAGPTGGTKEKPVGTVWLACVGPGDLMNLHRVQAQGDRRAVRDAAVEAAFALICRNLDEADA